LHPAPIQPSHSSQSNVEHSETQHEVITSSGLPNQQYVLEVQPYLDNSLAITSTDGTYALVADFLSSTATDRHATIAVDENSRAHIAFGDGVAGSIPNGAIAFEYKTGGGARGNVDANAIQRVSASYGDSLGNPVSVQVTNTAKASGGADAQTVESMREAAPRSLRTLTRTVSREDYQNNALRVAGVARALMMTRDEQAGIPENTGRLYLVPKGGGPATNALIAAVIDMITIKYPHTITFKPAVQSALYLPINISTQIHLARGAVPAVVGAAVRTALIEFFQVTKDDGSDNETIDFGYNLDGALAWSDVFNAIRDTRGVRKIDDGLGNLILNGQSDDVIVPPQSFPTLGTVLVIDALTGTAL
jgi:predicted phage baseplate assembly protein